MLKPRPGIMDIAPYRGGEAALPGEHLFAPGEGLFEAGEHASRRFVPPIGHAVAPPSVR